MIPGPGTRDPLESVCWPVLRHVGQPQDGPGLVTRDPPELDMQANPGMILGPVTRDISLILSYSMATLDIPPIQSQTAPQNAPVCYIKWEKGKMIVINQNPLIL